MSFLTDILKSKGKTEIEDLNEKIHQISKSSVLLKEEVTVAMEDKYVNHTNMLHDNSFLLNKMKTLSTQMDDVKKRIDIQMKNEIISNKDQLDSLKEALQEATLSSQLVDRLFKIHTALEAARNVQNNSDFLENAKQLKTVEDDLKNHKSGLECLEIFEALKSELMFQQSKHTYKTVKLWEQCLLWKKMEGTVKLALSTDLPVESLFRALYYYDMLTFELRYFADTLFADVLCPIITKLTFVECETSSTLTVKINSSGKHPLCINVLNNLTIVFNFLSLQLNFQAEDNVSFMSELQKLIGEEFCSFLIKNCLTSTVPKKRDELQAYKAIVEEITAFEALLKQIGFIDENDKSIGEYTSNVEELFVNKTCEAHLAAARNIMKKDLHIMKQVGPVKSDTPEDTEVTVRLTELSEFTHEFPSCQISKSAEELMELVCEILQDIPHNTDACAARLFYTARSIFHMYCSVVPEFHSMLLDTIPQQSAIVHNNAMYLAHQLVLLGSKYKHIMPPVLQSHTTTFIDLVDPLRTLAARVFTAQLQIQKKQIVNILGDSGLVTLGDNPEFPRSIEKAIRQCLRQLALLQTVWQHVLPENVYCKALGLLCNAFIEEIVQKVIAAEDIPSKTAAQLVVVFSLVQQKAPQVFPEPLEIHRHVKKWSKFGELMFLLEASLREVDDRWADGKGPLAQEFTVDQVRHLVRALFQISDKRAVLLAKIN